MANVVQHPGDGPRCYPVAEAFDRLGIGPTAGYQLIASGELQTFTIGRNRFVSETSLQRFIRRRIAASTKESAKDRAAKVEKAVAGRKRQREAVAA